MAADGVNFVNEHQARRALACLFKHIAHATGTNTDKHLHEIRAADAKEIGISLARNGLGQQGFAGARRANHQYALRNTAAEFLEFLGVL